MFFGKDEDRGADLFYRAHPANKFELSLDKRIDAAAELAKNPDYEKWVVVLLYDIDGIRNRLSYLDDVVDELGAASVDEMKDDLMMAERGVLAAILLNILDDASEAVLLAVTTKLDCREGGSYSKSGLFFKSDGFTAPLQEIARMTLRRCLDVDYEYDKTMWRKEILQKQRCTDHAGLRQTTD